MNDQISRPLTDDEKQANYKEKRRIQREQLRSVLGFNMPEKAGRGRE